MIERAANTEKYASSTLKSMSSRAASALCFCESASASAAARCAPMRPKSKTSWSRPAPTNVDPYGESVALPKSGTTPVPPMRGMSM